MIKPKFSTTYAAKRKRIQRLPKLVNDAVETLSLKDAMSVIIAYQDGLKNNNLRLTKLHDFSKQRKIDAGYDRPNSPLYGAGDTLDRTLYNALEIKKDGNRYILRFSRKRHHKSKLTLNQLHNIHENGALIKVTDKMRAFLHFIGLHLKASTKIIRIPPRPAYRKAVARMLRKRKAQENTKEVRRAIQALINNNDEKLLKKIQKFTAREKKIMGAIG